MDKKLLTPQDGLDAIARMTPGTRKFFQEEGRKILEEEMAGYEEDLIEYAEEEATEVAICLWKFRQKHDSCSDCSTRGFCDRLMKKLKEWEEEEVEE